MRFIPSPSGTPEGSLKVLTTGPVPPNPAEFAASYGIEHMLRELATRADVVLVDAAPLLQASESVALTAKVDGIVVVTNVSTMRRSTLTELRRTLEGLPTIVLGMIATGTTAGETYGYGYGYGSYGSDNGRASEKRDIAEPGVR
jgi:Mrp family chromosome partitioning ATPase